MWRTWTKLGLIAFCIVVALSVVCSPALALMPTATLPQDAPIRIDQCLAGLRPTGSGEYEIPNYYLDFAANFTNRSKRAASAVRLRFDLFNAFGEHLLTKYGTDDAQVVEGGQQQVDIQHDVKTEELSRENGTYSMPSYVPTWEFINTASTAHSVVCSVDTVMFTDGKKWQAADPTNAKLKAALQFAEINPGIFFKYEP